MIRNLYSSFHKNHFCIFVFSTFPVTKCLLHSLVLLLTSFANAFFQLLRRILNYYIYL